MKKLSLKSSTIALALILATILLALPSCRSLEPTILHDTTQYYTTLHHTVDTVLLRDSVFVREYLRGDTIYLTRTEWRERWRVRLVHDTIHDTQYIAQTIEHPPERYVPKFYKWCTGLFWAIVAGVILYYVLKIVIRYYLRK